MRTCSTCTQPFTPKVHTQRFCSSPCRDHKLGRKPRVKHGTTASRGYGSRHQRLRRQWDTTVQRGEAHCWRCHTWLPPGQPWHLGHDPVDRSVYRGPECPRCNTSDAAKRGNAARQRYTSSTPRVAR